MTEQEVISKIKQKLPFEELGDDIRVVDIQSDPSQIKAIYKDIRPDIVIQLGYGDIIIKIFGEIKIQVTQKTIEQVGEWLRRAKALIPFGTYALICPYLSPQNQLTCQKDNIDFIDLSGNILLRIPNRVFIERLNRPNKSYKESKRRNPFSGASSRVLRVLLNKPYQDWTITGISDELERESERQNKKGLFSLSLSSISKSIQSLEDEVLIRRDNLKIRVPDPKQLLFSWAEKYKDRYKWLRRSSFKTNNPFDFEVESSINKLTDRFNDLNICVSGSAAANFVAPFVNVDRIDVFLLDKPRTDALRSLSNEQSVGPDFQFFYAYDNGVAMYSQIVKNIKIVSDIQIYLDCYARGGRDAKQAEYILNERIEKEWQKPQ
jgi:hypothetical protein